MLHPRSGRSEKAHDLLAEPKFTVEGRYRTVQVQTIKVQYALEAQNDNQHQEAKKTSCRVRISGLEKVSHHVLSKNQQTILPGLIRTWDLEALGTLLTVLVECDAANENPLPQIATLTNPRETL